MKTGVEVRITKPISGEGIAMPTCTIEWAARARSIAQDRARSRPGIRWHVITPSAPHRCRSLFADMRRPLVDNARGPEPQLLLGQLRLATRSIPGGPAA